MSEDRIVDIDPTCPKCNAETYGAMILFTQGKCIECGEPLNRSYPEEAEKPSTKESEK